MSALGHHCALGFGGAHAEDRGAGSAAAQATTAEPCLELLVLLNLPLDSDLARCADQKTWERCSPPTSSCEEPNPPRTSRTLDQVSAIHQVITSHTARDCCTSAPASVGPPCPTVAGRGRSYLDRPPWHIGGPLFSRSTALLDLAPLEILDNFRESVRSHTSLYDGAWFVVDNADVRMRSELFKRLRRRAERDHADVGSAGSTSNYDPAKPWGTLAVADTEWWNENLHRPAILYLTRIKSAAAVEDGTAQPALERSGLNCHRERGPG